MNNKAPLFRVLSYIIVAFCIFSLSVALMLIAKKTSDQSYIETMDAVNNLNETFSRNLLGQAIITENKDVIQKVGEFLTKYDHVYYVRVYDDDNNLILDKRNLKYGLERSRAGIELTKSEIYTDYLNYDLNSNNQQEIVGVIEIATIKSLNLTNNKAIMNEVIKWSFIVTIVVMFLLMLVGFIAYFRITNLRNRINEIVEGKSDYVLKDHFYIINIDPLLKVMDDHFSELCRLKKYESELKDVSEMKNQILQIAAHELRSPVSSLKTYMGMSSELLDQKKFSEVESINLNCLEYLEALDRNIQSILDLYSIELGQFDKQESWIKIVTLLQDIEKHFKIVCESKGIKFEIINNISPVSCEIKIFVNLLKLVISNAVDNAIKYTNRGFVKVIFSLDDTLKIKVHDTGVGLNEDEVLYLKSDPSFFHKNIKRENEGWGVGMITMQKFTSYLNGSMDIESTKGLGTIINFDFPCAYRDEELIGNEHFSKTNLSLTPVEISNVTSNGYNVLVLDNDEKYLKQMQSLFSPGVLRRNDITVYLANSINDAIKLLEVHASSIDLMLIDYHMPQMDGFTFIESLSVSDEFNNKAVKYLVTADSLIKEDSKIINSKLIDGIFSKGLMPDQVRELIRKITIKAV